MKGKLYIQLLGGTDTFAGKGSRPIKFFSKLYEYDELVNKIKKAYADMCENKLNYFDFEDLKGCVHFVGEVAFKNAHIWILKEEKIEDD
jgi:hypothetical protein